MSVIVEGLARRFGTTAALDGVSLAVREGEFVALLGPSGSGKTTLLRVLAGLEPQEEGRVEIAGQEMAGVPARERGIGVVFQNYALFRHMNVFDNIAFGLSVLPRARRPRRAEMAERVRELLRLTQIPELERRWPDQLSGGERQRVALARALAIHPKLLLLDEPFGALDALVRREVRRWLRGLHDRLGITTLLVTHDQEEAMELADRVAVMERGRIAQFDTPAALLAGPTTPFVAGFVGEAARLEGRVAGGVLRFVQPGLPPLAVALPDGPASAFLHPRDVVAHPAPEGPLIRLARATAEGTARLVVELADGATLDAVAEPQGEWPQRQAACRLEITGAQVFAANGARGAAAPLRLAEVR
ncbi:ATP-binding cassette domain-containing protein [Siccirubricoccus sp. KC 17139]|uniref:ATP-binding cassette domain-containing protein n=1 Tax=Siccirubricoccus soli TaxID=2899147 RepID=A0ABT1D794_9PROT|nr:ATP-binding cassette domain-containing protein [Siccirubricoccus soli]MCO6417781.1 ATP-binding cassette domain-containing protein [Siccirubricoccus soli]MCP2683916.1 ATP-binding cassette domain-containing protein [Siccirubricoccus soli]